MRPVELSEYSEIVTGKNSEYLENKTGQIFRKFKIFQTTTCEKIQKLRLFLPRNCQNIQIISVPLKFEPLAAARRTTFLTFVKF